MNPRPVRALRQHRQPLGDLFDDLDREVLHALQIDARAPFRRIGAVLGVSDQTVARRYARLRATGAVRVLALGSPEAWGDAQWVIRVRAAPVAAVTIAEALAHRTDTSWINLCSGGTEIVGTAYGDGVEQLLLDALPHTRQVLDVQAEQVLHVFYGGPGEPFSKQGSLTTEQVARLAEHLPAAQPPPDSIDENDEQILAVLREDGRAPIERLISATGASAATVRRRLHLLRAGGVLQFDVDLDPRLMPLAVLTMLTLTVDPTALDAAGRGLAAHAEVAFAAAITGSGNLFASVNTAGAAALYRYLTRSVAVLPGVRAVTTTPVLRTVKAAATRYGTRPAASMAARRREVHRTPPE